MKCLICKHGETKDSRVGVTLERGGTTLIFRSVPAEVCQNCGEPYHSAQVTKELLKQAEAAASQGIEVDVRRFALAA